MLDVLRTIRRQKFTGGDPGPGATGIRSLVRAALIPVVLLLLPISVSAATRSSFDHLTTGFPLSGAHRRVQCEQCHIRGIFRGTPRRCVLCHATNSRIALGPSASHIRTTDTCEDCHTQLSWESIRRMDHAAVIGSCFVCHDGQKATGRPQGHFISSRACDDCHTTVAWSAVQMDHSQTTFPCQRCHVTPLRHPQVTPTCDDCHTTRAWVPLARMDHTLALGTCQGCHGTGTVPGKPPTHIVSSSECDACHVTTTWLNVRVDHNSVFGPCSRCHATAATHIRVTNTCEDCHVTTAWIPTTQVDHTAVLGGCVTCHDGQSATGKSGNHLGTTNDCDACHVAASVWTTVRMDHTQTTVTRCSQCHDGTPPGAGKPQGHMTTTSECDACHTTRAWVPTHFDHGAASGNCVSCHDNQTAIGKPQNHPSTSNVCDACHSQGAGWVNARMDHTQTTVTRCSQCHNGTPPGVGTPQGHMTTASECDACHTTNAWVPTHFDHSAASGTCASCHDNQTAIGKPQNHPNTSDNCDACHSQGAGWANARMDHTETTVARCSTCHNGTPPGAGKPQNHMTTTAECDACHTTSAWIPTNFDHSAVTGNCISCHDNQTAMGKPQNHPVTSNNCEACHTQGGGWASVRMDHAETTVTRCSTCHSTTGPGTGKPQGHMQTTSECDTCHTTTAWIPTNFSHSGAAGTCSSCHNGQTATGPPRGHFVTSKQCDACHRTGAGGWQSMNFRHSGNYPDHGRLQCLDCHKTNNEIIPWPSPAYQPDCAGCHANDYRSNPHKGASVSQLRNCAGTCHKSSPEHSPTRRGW